METHNDSKKTIIIEAAGEIFVEKGYRTTTIREISKRAGVNIAAINYYFGDKKRLYVDVLRYYKNVAFERYPPDLGIKENDLPEQKLKSFIHSIILRTFEEGTATWFGRLLAREFIEPTEALDFLIDEVLRPYFSLLSAIVKEILGKKATKQTIYLCSMSIIGQCIYFRNSQKIVSLILKKEKFNHHEINKLSEHISHFSFSALNNYLTK